MKNHFDAKLIKKNTFVNYAFGANSDALCPITCHQSPHSNEIPRNLVLMRITALFYCLIN